MAPSEIYFARRYLRVHLRCISVFIFRSTKTNFQDEIPILQKQFAHRTVVNFPAVTEPFRKVAETTIRLY